MKFWELLVIAVGLSMDAFAIAICKGLSVEKMEKKHMAITGAWFGGAQAAMPLLGYLLGSGFQSIVDHVDHWIAFVLLAFIGGNMLKEAFSNEECDCCNEQNADFSVKTMFTMAVATSIDALAIGVSLSLAGNVNIWVAITLIGITTGLFSAFGVKIGSVFGSKFEKKAQIAGGAILILLGTKILLEHLGIL